MIGGKRSTLGSQARFGKRSELAGGGSGGGGGGSSEDFPALVTRSIGIPAMRNNAFLAPDSPLLATGIATENRGDVVELTTGMGDYASINAIQVAAGMTSFYEFTYDASPADFAAGSDGLLDGAGVNHLTKTGTTITNFTAFNPYPGRYLTTSGSTSFDNLISGSVFPMHQAGPRGAVFVFRLGATPSDTRSLCLFGGYGSTSGWFVIRTVGGDVKVCEPGNTNGVTLGTAASLVNRRILVFVNLVVPVLTGAVKWEVTWGEALGDFENDFQTAEYTPAALAGSSDERIVIGGFSSNIYRVENMQVYHAAIKTTGCLSASHMEAFASKDFFG